MIQSFVLTDTERESIWQLALSIEAGYDNPGEFAFNCWRAGAGLQPQLARLIYALRQGRGGPLHLKGIALPFAVPPTPSCRQGMLAPPMLIARKMMALLLTPLGHLYNFRLRRDFDLIDDVFPIYADRNAQLGTNRDFLEWHVEDGFHPAKADLLALYCLRGDPGAKTYLCEARDLRLTPSLRADLERPDFLVHADPTLRDDGGAATRMAVLTPGADPEIVYDPAYMTGLTPAAEAALIALRCEVERAAKVVELEHGDLLVIDNRRVLHARSAYAPRYDGSDRWLLRALLLESLWKPREHLQELETGAVHAPSRQLRTDAATSSEQPFC